MLTARVIRQDGSVYNFENTKTEDLSQEVMSGSFADAADVSLYKYDQISMDGRSNATQRVFNPRGGITQLIDPLNGELNIGYNASYRANYVEDKRGNATQLDWDDRLNLISVTSLFNQANTQISYEPVYNQPTQIIDPLGRTNTFLYDVFGNMHTHIDPLGQQEHFTYNPNGQILTVTNKLGDRVASYVYDGAGRVSSMTDVLNRTSSYTYDLAGNVKTIIDPESKVTSYTYDNMGRVLTITAPDTGGTTLVYNPNGDLISLTDANGKTRIWAYNLRRQLITRTDPEGLSEHFTYDEVANVTSHTRKDGTVITMEYDELDRLVKRTLPAINGLPQDVVIMQYDEESNLIQIENNDSVISNRYDLLSRMTNTEQKVLGQAQQISYAFDVANRLTNRNDTAGVTDYSYDDLDRLIALNDQAGRNYAFTYDALSRMRTQTLPNGVVCSNEFDTASQLLSRIDSFNSNPLTLSAYTYNQAGMRTSELQSDGNTRSVGYDPNYRVTSIINDVLPTAYDESIAYDKEGNWLINGRVYANDNRLLEDNDYTYQYDAMGNLTSQISKSTGLSEKALVWDAENRLVQITTTNVVNTYAYDAGGLRVFKESDNGTTISSTRYLLEGMNVLLELDENNQLQAVNTHIGLDNLLTHDRVGEASPYYVHTDGLGSTIAISDNAGNVIERYRYTAFGELQIMQDNFVELPTTVPLIAYTYTGREFDSEVGIYYYRARYYDAEQGRWLSKDPIGIAGGLNEYAFVGNNPINYIDPWGLVMIQNGDIANVVDQAVSDTSLLQAAVGMGGLNVQDNTRFVETDNLGPIDLRHVTSAAGSLTPWTMGTAGGWLWEAGQGLRKQSRDSSFATEDLMSNFLGAVARARADVRGTSIGVEVERLLREVGGVPENQSVWEPDTGGPQGNEHK